MYTYQYGNAYSVCSILLEVESGGDGTLHIPISSYYKRMPSRIKSLSSRLRKDTFEKSFRLKFSFEAHICSLHS